jgi:hypothetical protein
VRDRGLLTLSMIALWLSAACADSSLAKATPMPQTSTGSHSSRTEKGTSSKNQKSLAAVEANAKSVSKGEVKNSAQTTSPKAGVPLVWVNTDSKVYHKPGSKWYGKTRHGKYMTEADARRAGYRPAAKE